MIREVFRAEEIGVTWIDVTAPTQDELLGLAAEHGLHAMSVEDALDPEHLPKYERIDGGVFIILRAYGPDREGMAMQDFTRKIAIFQRGDRVITIHRRELPVIAALEQNIRREYGEGACRPTFLVVALVHETLSSYDRAFEEAEETLAAFEAAVFRTGARSSPGLKSIYRLKGRVSLIRRLLWLTIGVVREMMGPQERSTPIFQDLREAGESYHFYAEQVLDEANNLLNVHLALASHRTNEVVRLLTLFSAFFLPLTFIVGVYGMNFDWMPELRQRWGYPAALVFMLAVTMVIYVWFRRRGWLRRPPED